jgi:hypothetical protein
MTLIHSPLAEIVLSTIETTFEDPQLFAVLAKRVREREVADHRNLPTTPPLTQDGHRLLIAEVFHHRTEEGVRRRQADRGLRRRRRPEKTGEFQGGSPVKLAGGADRLRSMEVVLRPQDRGHAGAQAGANDHPEGPDPQIDQIGCRRLSSGFENRFDKDSGVFHGRHLIRHCNLGRNHRILCMCFNKSNLVSI